MTGWAFMRQRRVLLLLGIVLGFAATAVLHAQTIQPPTEHAWAIWVRDNAVAIIVLAYHVGINFQEFKRLKSDVKELQQVDRVLIADLEAAAETADGRYVHKEVMNEILRTINMRFDHTERLIVGRGHSRLGTPNN